MRSPTLTVKSCGGPGVAALNPRSAAEFGVFFEAQPAMASEATSATMSGLVASSCDAAHVPPLLTIRTISLIIQ